MTRKTRATRSTKPKQVRALELNIARALDDLRQRAARTDALANAAMNLFNEVIRVGEGENRRQFERLAHLVGATSDVAQTVVEIAAKLTAEFSTHRSRA